MTARIIQIVCAFYLVAMSLAVGIHWWSLRDFTHIAKNSPSGTSTITAPAAHKPSTPSDIRQAALQTPPKPPVSSPASAPTPSSSPAPKPAPTYPSSNASRDEFYTSLLRQIENLQNQNRDLIDQLAETNREVMKLEFRVDSHSSQFRPLPVTEERQEAFTDEGQGVLPPRPLIIDEPFGE